MVELNQQKEEEIREGLEQMQSEVVLLRNAFEERGEEYDEEYAEAIMRSELQEIGNLVESVSNMLGEGPGISVTDVQIAEDQEIEHQR